MWRRHPLLRAPQALAALRRRLNRAIGTFDRVKHEFVQALHEAIEVEDIELSRAAGQSSGDHTFRSTLRPPRTGRYAKLKDKAEYWWKARDAASVAVFLRVAFGERSPDVRYTWHAAARSACRAAT
jgi:hypothetical protein